MRNVQDKQLETGDRGQWASGAGHEGVLPEGPGSPGGTRRCSKTHGGDGRRRRTRDTAHR